MYYEINVSYMGKHLFATAKRSLTTTQEYHNALDAICRKFTIEEEYLVTGSIHQDEITPLFDSSK